MTGLEAVAASIAGALLVVAAMKRKRKGTVVGGLLVKGPKGALMLRLTPARKGKKK